MSAEGDRKSAHAWRLAAGLLLVAALAALAHRAGLWQSPENLRGMGFGAKTAAAIIFAMAFAWAFALPASAFLFVTPMLFPPPLSALITTAGCALGAATGYLVARFVGGPWVEPFRAGRLRRFLASHSSFLVLFGIRLAPASPHGFINYAAGLASIPFARFVAATTLAMAIKSYAYAVAVRETVGAGSLAEALNWKTMLALFAVAALSVSGHMLRRHMSRGGDSPLAAPE